MKLFYFLFFGLLATACGHFPELPPLPSRQESLSLKVVNYNLWHGLGGSGILVRKELEPPAHKQNRLKEQLILLKKARPDILFLQEVNPVSSLSRKIAEELGMHHIYQKTNCGISILGLGVPVNLSMGIAVLARPPLTLSKISGVKLSGPAGFCSSLLSFQYAEFRYALFALAHHPRYGSFMLVNTHLHHGPEQSFEVREQINYWEERRLITADERTELENNIEAGNQRKMKELENLFSHLNELQDYYRGLPVILAGDLNSTVESPVYKSVVEDHQLTDSAGNYIPEPFTWNPDENKQNHKYTADFGVSAPTFGQEEIENFFKSYDQRQRRIDYVFVSSDIEVLSHSLFANKPSPQGIIGSDHFGLNVEMEILLDARINF